MLKDEGVEFEEGRVKNFEEILVNESMLQK
jgi:hypothetical protein